MSLELMYITNNPEIARIAENAGVNRIWIDLETLGKAERQKEYDSVKSKHSLSDIKKVKTVLSKSKLQVRINPINLNSKYEIDTAIEYGADVIMLPMFKDAEDVKTFINYVDGRVTTLPLLETKEAVEHLDEILDLKGIDEIHIGLNDLHLSMGKKFMFELLTDGTVDNICNKIKEHELPFGIGGIARLGIGTLPAENIIAEHYRIGSTMAILSRSFCKTDSQFDLGEVEHIFDAGVKEIRNLGKILETKDEEFFSENHKYLKEKVQSIVKEIR